MDTPLQVSWEHIEPSEFVLKRIEKEVAHLEKTYGRIVSCRVVVEGRSHRQHKGGLYGVRVHLVLPGDAEVTASRNPAAAHEHEDVYVAVRDAFGALERQLRDTVRARREESQHPDSQAHGIVTKILEDKQCGFITTDEGREIYFHANAVLNDAMDRLRVGAEVHFTEEEGEQGPQASTVRAFGVGKR